MPNTIKAVRTALHLSQREFGERLGVSRDVISNIEYGRVQPKPLLNRHICETYGVREEYLSSGEGSMFAAEIRTIDLAEEAERIFRTLKPEFQEYALEQIRGLKALQDRQGKK